MVETIFVIVVAGLILAGIIGGVALVRRRLRGTPITDGGLTRSDVRFLAKVTDYGNPPPGFITWRVGLVLDVEVHPLRTQPMRITEVGLELLDGSRLPLETASNLNTAIAVPDFVEASDYVAGIRKRVADAGAAVRGFYAVATPARTFRRALPRSWKGFPGEVPPPGST